MSSSADAWLTAPLSCCLDCAGLAGFCFCCPANAGQAARKTIGTNSARVRIIGLPAPWNAFAIIDVAPTAHTSRRVEISVSVPAMDLREKAGQLPAQPGVYLFQDASGAILYVGKARSLRARVKSYFLESRWIDAKTGSLVREIADMEYIVVDNEREALALENNLIKRHQPKFNVLLRDDKTYPYIRYTAFETHPRVYVTRRLKQDGSLYFGPYFPASLAYRLVHLIHKHFLVPSCTVDLARFHPRPCLQYYIHRCLGPCVESLVTDERYAESARDVRLFLEGRRSDLSRSLEERMEGASAEQRYEEAAGYRDLLRTLEERS